MRMEKKWRTVIGPKSGLLDMDVKEIWKYRDLCLTFIRKNYITKYKQTVFGPFYMILSPLLTSGIFTVVFGTIAGIATDGIVPVVTGLAKIEDEDVIKCDKLLKMQIEELHKSFYDDVTIGAFVNG